MTVNPKIGKEYLREIYSPHKTNDLLTSAVKKFHADCILFQDQRNTARGTHTISYDTVKHRAVISSKLYALYTEEKWDRFERDHLVFSLQEFSKAVFPSDAAKADAVFKYVMYHGLKKAGQTDYNAANFIAKCDVGSAVEGHISAFFNKIITQKFKTVDEKKEEDTPEYKIKSLESKIKELKAELARVVIFDPNTVFPPMIARINEIKCFAFSADGKKLAAELFATLEEIKQKSASKQLHLFDRSKLQNKNFVNILHEDLIKRLAEISNQVDKYFDIFRKRKAIKKEIRQINQEILELKKSLLSGSQSLSSQSSTQLLTSKSSSAQVSVKSKRTNSSRSSTQSTKLRNTTKNSYKKSFKLKSRKFSSLKPSLKKRSFCFRLCQKLVSLIRSIWKKLC